MKLIVATLSLGLSLSSFAAGPEWTYSFPDGPAQWGTLESYSACALGSSQSPISIETGVNADISNVEIATELPELNLSFTDIQGRAAFNGHTVQASLPGEALNFNGGNYSALQFHFHSPSEHVLNERQYPLEAHFVHQSSSGKLLVVGVFFEEGDGNAALEATWKSTKAGELRIPLQEFFPRDLSYLTYQGSLTTPPCSEGVTWVVLKTPVEASREQLKVLQTITGGPNNRPVQSLNGRSILTDSL